jgi:hypothetical protein
MMLYTKTGIREEVSFTTLKKEYSISCKDYITLGLMSDNRFIVLCGESQLTYPVLSLETANEYFYFYVNKI